MLSDFLSLINTQHVNLTYFSSSLDEFALPIAFSHRTSLLVHVCENTGCEIEPLALCKTRVSQLETLVLEYM